MEKIMPKANPSHTTPVTIDHPPSMLRGIVEKIERLREERAQIGYDIQDVFKTANLAGFDVKAIRHLIDDRKKVADADAVRSELADTLATARAYAREMDHDA